MSTRRNYLIQRRRAAGLTQEALAAALGVDRSTIARWEAGASVPGLWARRQLAEALEISVEAVVDLIEDRPLASATLPEILPADAERSEARRLLGHAGAVVFGSEAWNSWGEPADTLRAPAPRRIGASDVEHLVSLTAAMRGIDYAHGGGACRDAVAAQARWAEQLLDADCAAEVRINLLTALADLHSLAGWSSFDVGMYSTARGHFARAIEQAREAEDDSLTANVLYRMGRLHLHRGLHHEALRFFQLAQVVARRTGCGVTIAMLTSNEAWAYAYLDDLAQMNRSLRAVQDEFASADHAAAASWVTFFDADDLDAMIGTILTALPSATEADMGRAIGHLDSCVEARGPEMARSLTFEQTALAIARLRVGDHERAVAVGRQALDSAAVVRSIRTIDRLTPLRIEASRARMAEASDMAHEITMLQTTA